MFSFIDDVIIYAKSKFINQNCRLLSQITQEIFQWIKENNVQFNDSKSEFIHFEKTRNHSKDSIILFNDTQIQPKSYVKWLDIWLNKKLRFKRYIEIRVNNITNALYLISNLFKSEWELSANAARQLYFTCVLFIAEYGSEIWFQN